MIPPSQFGDTTYTKVFVGGLPWETKKETMKKYFDQFGHILEAVVITDKNTGRSKGYGFVTFADPEAAMRACVDPAPVIDGRRANCNLASFGVQKAAPTTPQNGSHGSARLMKSFNNAGAAFPNPAVAAGLPLYSAPAIQPVGIPPCNVYGYPPYSAEYTYPANYYNVYGGVAPAQYQQMYGAAGATAGAFYPYYQIGQHGTTGAAAAAYGHGTHGYASNFQGYNTMQYPQMFQYSAPASPAVVTGFAQQYYGGGPMPLAPTTPAQPVCYAVKQA